MRERLTASLRSAQAEDDEELALSRPLAPGKSRASDPRWTGISRRAEEGFETPPEVGSITAAQRTVEELRASGMALPDALRKRLEAELRVDLGAVRLHTDDRAAAAARQIGARAFAVGTDIFFAAGAYDPEATGGIELIAHEVAHVAQNMRGERPSDGKPIVDPDHGTEQKADAFAHSFTEAKARNDRDPASVINRMRATGQRVDLPSRQILEEQLGQPLDFVEMYAGEAARVACGLMAASAVAVRNVIALADPSPQREMLLHELAHVVQMGGRGMRAPSEFDAGSLNVSRDSDPAEHDARQVARGGAPAVTADANTIHRTPTGTDPAAGTTPAADDKPWDLQAAVDAFPKFLATLDIREKDDPDYYFFVGDGEDRHDFETSSKNTFQRAAYQQAIGHTSEADKKKSEDDLVKLRNSGRWKDVGLVHVAPGNATKDSRRWAYILKSDPKIQQDVKYVHEEERGKPDPKQQWETYRKGVLTCHEKGSLKDFTQITIRNTAFAFDRERRFAPTDADNKVFRAEIEKAILADKQFEWRTKSFWKVYYDHVAKPAKFPQGLAGEIFKNLVKRDLGGDQKWGEGEAFIYHKDLQTKTKTRRADGFTIDGEQLLLEAKSGQDKGPGTDDDSKLGTQASDYAFILREKVEAYTPTDAAGQGAFKKVVYVFQTPQIAAKWAPQLKKWFGDQAENLIIIPPPDAIGSVEAKTNPTFNIPLTDKNATTHKFNHAPFVHPGMNVREAVIHTKGPGSSELAAGSTITYDVTLGNKLVSSPKPVTKTLNPEGGSVGRFDSKIDGLESSLKNVFKRLTTDAKLVDGGVEATINVTAGDSGIPGLKIVEPTGVTVRYVNDQLTVIGAVGVSDSKDRFKGKVSVGWASGEWTFEGSVDVPANIVDGLSAFTGKVKYEAGKWTIGVDSVDYEKQFGAIRLHGQALGVSYNIDKGSFDGFLRIDADLGMFGTASATADLKDNKLANATFSYDSPELKYPAKSDKPAFTGTVGGTLKYNEGKFSGDIRGTANIAVPALQKIAGEKGIGLAIDAHIGADGSYSGTIKSTNPLKFGKYLEIPSLSCTLEKDGAVTGDFSIKVVNLKHLDKAAVECTVNKDGISIKSAAVAVSFEEGKFSASLSAGYSEEKGLDISGTVKYKIKDDMTAVGTLTYDQKTNAVSLDMKVEEITLVDKTISKTLFKASKQIPVVNIYGLGIYVDIGFDLGFDFGFKITMTPEVDFVGLSLDNWKFEKIAAKLKIGGDIFAQLTGTPKLGIGVFALDPSIIRGGGGLKVPIVGRLDIKPSGEFGVSYKPDGGVDGTAKLGLAGQFGITGSLKPYAEFSVLNDMWNPTWEGEALASFEILKPKELFNFTVDFAGDNKGLKDGPQLPEENQAQAPREPTGDRTAKAEPAAPTDKGGDANKDQPAKSGEVAESGDQGPFSLEGLLDKFKGNKTVATASKIFEYAKKVWKVIKPIYDIVEPIVELIGKRIEAIIDLFDTEAPTADNIVPWLFKLAGKLWNVAFGGLSDIAHAIRTIFGAAVAFAKKFITRAVTDGQIGVKRHSYYIWMPWPKDNIEFMAAAEYKVVIPGVASIGPDGPPGFLLRPSGAISLVLYEALEAVGIGYSYVGNSDINQPYNDIWYGAGARG